MSYGFYNGYGVPVFFNSNDVDEKYAHDTYNIYVNEDYVGKKTLWNESERVNEVDDYLIAQGFTNFRSNLIGNKYIIHTGDGSVVRDMENTLNVYLTIE